MKAVILCGGLGTRLAEETDRLPKPMVEIGGRPILWHIMQIYGAHGFCDFELALGYKGEVIKEFFLHYYHTANSLSVHLGGGVVEVDDTAREDWRVHLVDTGANTQTGGRIKRLSPFLRDGTFMLTYGDGVADVDLADLVAFHRSHGRLATITAVRPPARFGALSIDGDVVTSFAEKPQAGEGWINGGFFVLEPGVLEYVDGDGTVFEADPLERLAKDGQLAAYRHTGFWQPMDTLRDVRQLQDMWASGSAPWKVWRD